MEPRDIPIHDVLGDPPTRAIRRWQIDSPPYPIGTEPPTLHDVLRASPPPPPAGGAQPDAELREALSWALDMLDMYDERLASIDGRERVYTAIHVAAKAKARAAYRAAEVTRHRPSPAEPGLREAAQKVEAELYAAGEFEWAAKLRAALAPPDAATPNQCDGCRRGLPLVDGLHSGEGYDMIGCTADRYRSVTDDAALGRALREALAGLEGRDLVISGPLPVAHVDFYDSYFGSDTATDATRALAALLRSRAPQPETGRG